MVSSYGDVSFLLLLFIAPTYADCTWKIKSDLAPAILQPLYINPDLALANDISDVRRFWLPQHEDQVTVPEQKRVLLVCPGTTLKGTLLHELIVTCSKGQWLDSNDNQHNFKDLVCKQAKQFQRIEVKPLDNSNPERVTAMVGFTANGQFYRIMELCFNTGSKDAVYSKFLMIPEIKAAQKAGRGPDFVQSETFYPKKFSIERMYKNQKQTLDDLIGDTQKYIQKNANGFIGTNYLSVGHLTANSDFVYGAHQYGTYLYMNAAPQWQAINGGNWAELEQKLQKFAAKQGHDLVVYTGTHGVLKLQHEVTKDLVDIYLRSEPSDTLEFIRIKVPLMYWKVVYDSVQKKGIAFVAMNSPLDDRRDIDNICVSQCTQLTTWLLADWKYNDFKKGYATCCNVNELRNIITDIPALDVSNGLLN